MPPFTKPPKPHYLSYHIARGEQGVLTYEPYKSHLLPHWRFRTVPIAQSSAETLFQHFQSFYEQDDFVGMDMARKFIQMGMTRSKRYANYQGGKKYEGGVQKEKSEGHEGKEEKEEASLVFRGYWERCREHEGYRSLKEAFLKEQREWEKDEKNRIKGENGQAVKLEENDEIKLEDNEEVKKEEDEEEVKALFGKFAIPCKLKTDYTPLCHQFI